MTNRYWNKKKPSKKSVSGTIWWFDQLTHLSDEIEETTMMKKTIIEKACIVLNDLEVLTDELFDMEGRNRSPNTILDVRKSYSYKDDLVCDFRIIYNYEDDEIVDENWYVKNKLHVHEILKKWIEDRVKEWSFEISDLDHETDFEIGTFNVLFSIRVTY